MEELVEVLLSDKGLLLERISSQGVVSPDGFWYEDKRTEWVMVVKGSGELEFFDGARIMLRDGEHYLIAPMRKHRVSFTSPDCVWITLYY